MKKLNIINIAIVVNNKEKINIISLEHKTDKYILYSGTDINDNEIDNNYFIKMEFKENMNILPKKKYNDLKFNVITNNISNTYKLVLDNICLNYVTTYSILLNFFPAFVTFFGSNKVVKNLTSYEKIFLSIFHILHDAITYNIEE